MKKYPLIYLLAIIFCFGVTSAHGNLMEPCTLGARGFGMGAAVVALPSDLPSIFYNNPAGLSQMKGDNIDTSFCVVILNIKYHNPNTSYKARNRFVGSIPMINYSHQINEKLSDARPEITCKSLLSQMVFGFTPRAVVKDNVVNAG